MRFMPLFLGVCAPRSWKNIVFIIMNVSAFILEVYVDEHSFVVYAQNSVDWAWPGDSYAVIPDDSVSHTQFIAETICTVAFPATDDAGDHLFFTAGQCGSVGEGIYIAKQSDMQPVKIGTVIYSSFAPENASSPINVGIGKIDYGQRLGGKNYHIEYEYTDRSANPPVYSLVCMKDDYSDIQCGQIKGRSSKHTLSVTLSRAIRRSFTTLPVNICSTEKDLGAPVYGVSGAVGFIVDQVPHIADCVGSPWLELGEVRVHEKKNDYVTSYITPISEAIKTVKNVIPGIRLV